MCQSSPFCSEISGTLFTSIECGHRHPLSRGNTMYIPYDCLPAQQFSCLPLVFSHDISSTERFQEKIHKCISGTSWLHLTRLAILLEQLLFWHKDFCDLDIMKIPPDLRSVVPYEPKGS